MKCLECSGTGEVKPTEYQEHAMPLSVAPISNKKRSMIENILSSIKDWIICLSPIVIGSMPVSIILCMLIFITTKSSIHIATNHVAQGTILVQYAIDGSVQKCWISGIESDLNVKGSTASININDLNNIDPKIVHDVLGINDLSTCVRYYQ